MSKYNQDSFTKESQTDSVIGISNKDDKVFKALEQHISDLKDMLVDLNERMSLWKYKIEKGKGWTSSSERKMFFKLIQSAKKLKQKGCLEIKGTKANYYTTIDPASHKCISLSQQIGAKVLQEPIQAILQRYRNATPFTIKLFKRNKPFPYNWTNINGNSCFEVKNIFSAINFILSDEYYYHMKQQYNQYLVSVLSSDLSWINNNPTLPQSHSFVNQHIVRKTYLQLAQNLAHSRMYDIIQTYDIQLMVEVIWRQVFYNNDMADKEMLRDMNYFPEGFLVSDHLRTAMRGFVDEKIIFNDDYYEISITVFQKKSIITCKDHKHYIRYEE